MVDTIKNVEGRKLMEVLIIFEPSWLIEWARLLYVIVHFKVLPSITTFKVKTKLRNQMLIK